MITFGAAPNPCPIVAPELPVPVYLTTLNLVVALADVYVEVIVPSEFDEPVPPAFQFQET